MLNEICAEIKNYFTFETDKHFGDFEIIDGRLTPSFDVSTDYIRIVGSHKNDGVHKRGADGFELIDEGKFHGAVWVMSPTADFLGLVAEIEQWETKYGGVDSVSMSPFQSESFGGYSYSKASGGTDGSGATIAPSWRNAFSKRLNIYRKIRV